MSIASRRRTRRRSLEFMTGIAVAFPRSPMIAASLAWELAENTGGTLPPRSRQPGEGARRAPVRRRVRSARPTDARLPPGGPSVPARLSGRRAARARRAVLQALVVAGGVGAAPARVRRHQGRRVGRRSLDVPHGRRARRRHPRPPAPLAPLPAEPVAAERRGRRGPGRPIGRRRRPHHSCLRRPGRHARRTRRAARSDARSRSRSTARPRTTRSSSTTSASTARRPG